MHDADALLLEIAQPAPIIVKHAEAFGVERDSQCVDREIAPMQVELQAAAFNFRKRGGTRIEFSAG